MPGTRISERDREVLKSLAQRIDPADAGAHNNLGVLYYQKGLVEEAISEFTRALEINPRLAMARKNLEIAYRDSGRYHERASELEEALQREPDSRDIEWELGRTYSYLGRPKEAKERFERVLSRDERDVGTIIQLALVEKSMDRLEAATAWLVRACEVQPQNSEAHYQLGTVLHSRNMNPDSLIALKRACSLNQESAEAFQLMSTVLTEMGHHDEARVAGKRAHQIDPDLAKQDLQLSLEQFVGGEGVAPEDHPRGIAIVPDDAGTMAHYNLGIAFRQQKFYREAVQEFKLALENDEDRRLVLEAMAESYLLEGDLPGSLKIYDSLIQELTNSPKLWNERGVVLHQLGRSDEAVRSYRRAVAIAPEYALASNNLAVKLALKGSHDQALELFKTSLQSDPGFQLPRLNLALLLLKLRRFQLALQVYRKVLGKEDSAEAWNGIGLVLSELERQADARNAFVRAVECDPELAEAHYNLSFALSSLGEYDAALRAVTTAQELEPYYVPHKFRLAIDLQQDEAGHTTIPEISADIELDDTGQTLQFDQSVLDRIFAELESVRDVASVAENQPYALVVSYIEQGLLDQAAAEVNRAMSHGADPAEGSMLSGRIFHERGLYGEALERFRAAKRLDPAHAAIRLGEILALLALGRGVEALPEAESLAGDDPANVDALLALARTRVAAGLPVRALDALNHSRHRAPQRADIPTLQGEIALAMGDMYTARRAFDDALGLDPGLVEVWVQLGRLHEMSNDWGAAEGAYRSALEIDSKHSGAAMALADLCRTRYSASIAVNILVGVLTDDPANLEALLLLGHALLEDGRGQKALEAFHRVLAQDPRNVRAYFFIGVVLARLKRYTQAVAAWEKVIRLDPSGPFARQARKHARTAINLKHIFNTEAA